MERIHVVIQQPAEPHVCNLRATRHSDLPTKNAKVSNQLEQAPSPFA